MFCHLFRLLERTSIALNEFQNCSSECKLYREKNNCSICEKKMENLTKEKYNWVLETRIQFDSPKITKAGNTSYLSAICLIHPSHSDMWIVYCLRHNKIDDSWEPFFKLFYGTECKEFDTLDVMNSYLKTNGYPGRKLTIDDIIKKEKKNVHN